jgi:hypothetical protein
MTAGASRRSVVGSPFRTVRMTMARSVDVRPAKGSSIRLEANPNQTPKATPPMAAATTPARTDSSANQKRKPMAMLMPTPTTTPTPVGVLTSR